MNRLLMVILLGLPGVVGWAATTAEESRGEAVWRSEFMGRDFGVLSESRSFVRGVRVCGGLPRSEETLALVMTVLQHEANGRRSSCGRLAYFDLAFGDGQMAKHAEWMKGGALDGAESRGVESVFRGYARRFEPCIPYMDPGSTMFVGMARAMKRNVFGWRFDVAGACRKLEEQNGWKVDVETGGVLTYGQLVRALDRRLLPILTPRKGRSGTEKPVLALGACSNAAGQYVVCVSPVECGLGQSSYFDQVSNARSGYEWGSLVALPGSGDWNKRLCWQKEMWPDDLELVCTGELPPGCMVVPYEPEEWTVSVVGNMRPAWEPVDALLEKLVVTNKTMPRAAGAVAEPESDDSRLWAGYFMGHETASIRSDGQLIPGVRGCPAGGGVGPFEAAFAMVVAVSHPEGARLVERSYEWRRVVQFSCEERWRRMSAQEQVEIHDRYYERSCSMPTSLELQYTYGERLWSVDAEGERQLRAMYQAATNGVALGPVKPVEGKTCLQQVAERLLPMEGTDPVETALGRVADRYGWSGRKERVESPSFAVLRRGVDMGLPALLQMGGAGTWVVGVGYVVAGGAEYMLVIDPAQLKPERMAAGATQEEHDFRMALPERFPGHGKYLKAAEQGGYVTDRLLDPVRPLPEGCHFVRMNTHPFAAAFFIHDWTPAVCGQQKIVEIVARTKPEWPALWR